MAAPNLIRVESREDLLARLEEMPSVELEAYAMEALTLTTLLTSVLQRRFPAQYHQWTALVEQAIQMARRGDGDKGPHRGVSTGPRRGPTVKGSTDQ